MNLFDEDVTGLRAAQRAAERSARLQAVTAALSEALTPEDVGAVVVEQGLAVLEARRASVVLLDKTGTYLEVVASAGYPAEMIAQWRRFPLAAPTPLGQAIRSGQPCFIDSREALVASFPELAAQSNTDSQAFAAVPLTAEGRVLGGIGLSFEGRHTFEPEDRVFIQALAQPCALALERARLYKAEQQARQAAEQQADRLARLQAMTAALATALTQNAVAEIIVSQGMAALEAQAGGVMLLRPGEVLELAAAVGYEARFVEAARRLPLALPVPITDVVRSGEPIWIESNEALLARYPDLAQTRTETRYEALALIPLAVSRRRLGGVLWSFAQPRQFQAEEQEFLLMLTGQCAQALERARLYEAEQEARQVAEQQADRLARLQTVTAALARTLTPAQAAGVIVDQGLAALRPDAGAVIVLSNRGSGFEVLGARGYPAAIVDRLRRHLLTASWPMADALRTGQPVLLPSIKATRRAYPYLASSLLPKYQAWAILPLLLEERAIGAMSLSFRQERDFHTEEVEFMLTLAGQCAQTLERTRLYEAEASSLAEAEQEIEARKQAEKRLETALREKEVLLREVNHRVKNNLQAVSNLLYLQANYIQDPQVRQKFEETRNRVRSIALIHEQLYRTQDFSRIDFALYLKDLARNLIHSYRIKPDLINLQVETDGTALEIDAAVPLGVIVTELVSNSLQHAFPGERHGKIRIEVQSEADGRLRLAVSDDGVGFPEDRAPDGTDSLGLQLVQMLASHMRGTVELERAGGTRFTILLQPAEIA